MGIIETICLREAIEAEQAAAASAPVSPLDAALEYINRGFAPVPVPCRSKKPLLADWQDLRITADTAANYFSQEASNVGVILGTASGELADVDIDCVEALAIKDRYLPGTPTVFGRCSKPQSHRLYLAPGARTKQFRDPLTQTTLVELRANGGAQTVFPGSIHEGGEAIEWHTDGEPTAIEAPTLLAAVAQLAVASLLVRYVGSDAIEQPTQIWSALLDAHDHQLGAAARRWLEIDGNPAAAPAEAPNAPEPAQAGGFEHSEQFEQGAATAPETPAGSVFSGILQTENRQRYAERALADEVARVSAAMPGGQHSALFLGAARMGELVGAGAIDAAIVSTSLTSATSGWPIDPEKGPWFAHQIERTISDGIKKGMTNPRDLSKVGVTVPATAIDDDVFGPAAGAMTSTALVVWPPPDLCLINDDRPPAPALEDDALPAGWAGWIKAEAEARGCPSDYIAAALLGFASGWIGNARHVMATSSWVEPPHLWFAEIGGPSSGKSPAIRPFVEATRAIEQEAEPAWITALSHHAALVAAAEFAEENWRDSVRTATKAGKAPPDRPVSSDAPPPPPRPRLVAMDATTQELQRMLAAQPRGLLYFRDELAGWLGDHDRYGGHGGDRAFYLECWNGAPYVVDRVKHNGVPIRIDRASLAIVGGMQPDKLREVLEGADDGLAARLFYIEPKLTPIGPLIANDAEAAKRQLTLVNAARRMYGLGMGADPLGKPAPHVLRLDPDAFELFAEMRRAAMQRARDSRGLAAGWHGKNPGRALRLAANCELLAWAARGDPDPTTISADAMVRAGGYLDYAAGMLDRVIAGLVIGQTEKDAAVIARHILGTRAARLNERTLYQSPGWGWLRETPRRAAALAALDRAGWLRPTPIASNGRPRGDWDVSPRLWETRP